jgi:hypothetical protein
MYKKVPFFCLTVLLEGGDEIRSFSLVYCDEIKHPQTVTFLWQIENIFRFLLHFTAFRHFFEKFNTFWYHMDYLYI